MSRAHASRISRRRVIRNAALLGATAWLPAFRFGADDPSACDALPDFPGFVPLWRQGYRNWSGQVVVDDVWTCAPRTGHEVLLVADWAAARGYRLRPRGASHNWSPIVLAGAEDCAAPVVLVSTVEHMTRMSLVPGRPGQVRVDPGVSLEALLGFLGAHGLGFTNTPAIGEVTVGGMLAVAAHGTSVPAEGEQPADGKAFGSISDRVVELTVVGWDQRAGRHRFVRIPRHSPAAAPVLANLGRVFVTSVVLQAAPDVNLRCVSRLDIPVDELLGPPERGGRSVASFLAQAGRVEVIWYPFTQEPWLKIWSEEPTRPLTSRPTSGPNNYPFSDNIPPGVEELAAGAVTNRSGSAALLGPTMRAVTLSGLTASAGWDLWGPSRHLLQYVKATTMRVNADGYAVLVPRAGVQAALSILHRLYVDGIQRHRARGSYPINMPVEVRITGLDAGMAVGEDAVAPLLSPLSPPQGRSDIDVAIYFNSLSLTHTPGQNEFWAELEGGLRRELTGTGAIVRPEWTKGWAYTADAAFSNEDGLSGWIPDGFGREAWSHAVRSFEVLDPNGIFTNPFLERLLAV